MKFKNVSTLTGDLTSVYYYLEGIEIHMGYDGDSTYKSTDTLSINDNLMDVTLRVYGLNGAGWKLEINAKCIDDDKYSKKYEFDNTIEKKGTDLFTKTINLVKED